MSTKDEYEEYVARYCVVKHSWKGRYMRVFCIGKTSIATINPGSIFKLTNKWDYVGGVVDVVPETRADVEFSLITKKGNGTDNQTFSCLSHMERCEMLTDAQSYRLKFDLQWQHMFNKNSFTARKYRNNEEYAQCSLVITNIGIVQKNGLGEEVGTYLFMHINGFTTLADNPNALIIHHTKVNKLHQYVLEGASVGQFAKLCSDFAGKYIGMKPFQEIAPMTSQQFDMNRLGIDRNTMESTAEFPVMKMSLKHRDAPIRRVLATSETCILERDPATYNCTSAYFLADVYALIRCEDDAQKLLVEYKDPYVVKTYTSPVRDALLAHLVDACRASGNRNVSVIMKRVDRGKRAAPCRTIVNEEIESTLLKCLIEPSKGGGPALMPFHEVVEFFNANVEYNGLRFTENRDGLFAENREKLIFQALMALLENFPRTDDPAVIVQQFYALRRLCVTRIGFSSAAIVPTLVKGVGAVSVRALKMHNSAVSHAVMDFLCTLMTPHHNNYDAYHEQVNKNRMLASSSFLSHLLILLKGHIESDSGSLVIQALLDFFVFSICPPYSESTEEGYFSTILSLMVEQIGKSIYLLFGHHCKAIRFSAGNIVRVILEEGDEDQFFTLQRAALSEGGFLRQFHIASFNRDRPLRDLARKLIAYWAFENQITQDLLRRMLPITLLHFLKSNDLPPEDERELQKKLAVNVQTQEFLESKQGWFKKSFHPNQAIAKEVKAAANQNGEVNEADRVICYRQRIVKVEPKLNWALLFHELKQDHLRPDLIWSHNTRTELREAIEAEMAAFQLGLELRKERCVCWNYQEFEVQYPSLSDELRIGIHYPRLLFESSNPVVARPKEFFNDMYHRFLLVQDFNMKNQCLHGMSILYKHYAEEIGQFNDIEFMVKMLETATHPTFRDRMLMFLCSLLGARLNVKPFIDCNGVKPLVDLLTLAHLHIDRPQIHSATNAIEFTGSPIDLQDQEKEWHYTDKKGEKQPPVSFTGVRKLLEEGVISPNTKVWAQGLGGWKDLKDVPQLKWGIIAKNMPSVMTLSEVTSTILDIFQLLCAYYPSRDPDGSVMQPLPRVKRYLSDPSVLPHIVQLLLTFDPTICSRVHTLLYLLMEDNPLVPRFFLTGAFFFSLMYMASDVLPLCRLLHLTHRKQSFRIDHDNEIIRHSVLSVLLPPALVCYITNHGPIKFAEVYLGEYETPEAIWGKDMRRYLVEKIAAHISDFTPRLMGNVRAVYQYCPIVGVEYETLRNELFCSQYYLKHFCDELRYPNWPVADPVALMRDCLNAWKLELEKEPCKLSRESCLEELEIKEPTPTQQQIRKAYFKLAAVFHPDKNPNGRERFEAIQSAYEFLASEKVQSDAPDPIRIALLIKAQAILFKRFSEEMSKYKYAGYGLLLKLIHMEYTDPDMLHKDPCVMDPAIELAYYTVHNAPLNADELLQEGGIDLIHEVMNKCFEQLIPSNTDDMSHVSIAKNCIRTMNVSATFPDCLERILTYPSIPYLAAKGIAFEKAPALSRASIHCCESLCGNKELQQAVIEAGAVWHLLLFLFRFDYTLEDCGVETNEENHTQLFANRAAIGALKSIYALVGFQPDDSYLKTEPHIELYRLLQHLLTPYIVGKMRRSPGAEADILKILNSNHETPYLLWNNLTRAELRDFCGDNSEKCRDGGLHSTNRPSLAVDGFAHTAHSQELVVGGVFVRIYNLQPTFPLEEPQKTFQTFITYIDREIKECGESKPRGIGMIMEALRNIVVSYPVCHAIAEKYMGVLLDTLMVESLEADEVQRCFEMLAKSCAAPNCSEALGRIPHAIAYCILAMDRGGDVVNPEALQLMRVLCTEKNCVQQMLDKGMYVILIHTFQRARKQEVKEDACICLAKACSDKLNGPKVQLRCAKLLPLVMIETMKENPSQVCQMFDSWQENPELVWNKDSQARAMELSTKARENIVDCLKEDIATYWKMPEDLSTPSIDDLQVGGVYLALFMKQPNWAVRKPREFLMAIFEKFVEVASAAQPNPEILELVADSTVSFLTSQKSMADYIVALGYIPKIITMCDKGSAMVSMCTVRILHEIACSKPCVESMGAGPDVVSALMGSLTHCPDEIGLPMDTMERLMSRSSEKANMVRLALNSKIPQKLLAMLETGMPNAAQPPAARAIIVKVLKAMVAVGDPIYGPEIDTILSQSAVWAKYKSQSHELFLTGSTFGGYITGPKGGGAANGGYLSLAAPATQTNDSEPPPLDD